MPPNFAGQSFFLLVQGPVVVEKFDFVAGVEKEVAVGFAHVPADEIEDSALRVGFASEVVRCAIGLDEVLTEPLEDGGEIDSGLAAVDAKAVRTAQEGAGLIVELLIEIFSGVRLVAERRAAHGCTNQRDVNAGLTEFGAQRAVLDFVQGHFAACDDKAELVPDAGDLTDAVLGINDRADERRFNGVVANDRFQRESVVGVDPEGDLLLIAPGVELAGLDEGQGGGECVEITAVGLQAAIIYHSAVIHVAGERGSIALIGKSPGVGSRSCRRELDQMRRAAVQIPPATGHEQNNGNCSGYDMRCLHEFL